MPDPKDSETIFDDEPEQSETSDSVPEKVEEEQSAGEEKPQEGAEEEEGEDEQSLLATTTFKTVKDLIAAYKELQANSTRRNQEFSEMQGLLKQVFPLLTAKQQAEAKEDPDAFMKAFVMAPKETLLGLIKEALQVSIRSTIEPLQGEVRGLGANLEFQTFLSKHPELEEKDVDPFLKIMDEYPQIRERKDRLEVWLKLLKHERPEIGQRTAKQKESLEQGVSDAKKAAGLGGQKSSAPKSTEGDPFDEILEEWNTRQAYFNRK